MLVKSFKDNSGQEFVAEIVNEEPLEIKNPIVYIPTENGLMPMSYLVTSRSNLIVKSENLIFDPFEPTENVLNSYKEMFGGIVTKQNNLIL